MQLETPRLLLVPREPQDWLELRPLATDPQVMRYISNGQRWPDERIRDFVDRQIAGYAARGFCPWKLLLRDTHSLAGFCGLQPLEGTPDIEIGWWLARAHWGQGLATEAAREALRDGFERVGLRQIVAVAQRGNRASIRVMEKLGMTCQRDTIHRGYPAVLYSIANPATLGHRP